VQTFPFKQALVGAVLGATLLPAAHANADGGDTLRWQTIVGIVDAKNVVGSGTGAIAGGGQPWTTSGGRASVNLVTGEISFDVRGLVFAGGNTIGTPLPVRQVVGTLVCDTDGSAGGGNSVVVDTPVVPLDATGDAHFSGNVALPAVCISEPDTAFLIRVPALKVWIGNGAILR
jgi:hypothetical protein